MSHDGDLGSGPGNARLDAMSSARRAVRLSGFTDESQVRAALSDELRARGVDDATGVELDGLVVLVTTSTGTGFRLLRGQAKRIVGTFREMRTYAEPRWALPRRGVPSPPEPDLSSTEISLHLTPADLGDGRDVVARLIDEIVDQGANEPERGVTPWVCDLPDGRVGVHIGQERIAVVDRVRAEKFLDAIARWGEGTGMLSVHATLHGGLADTADMTVFVSLPADR